MRKLFLALVLVIATVAGYLSFDFITFLASPIGVSKGDFIVDVNHGDGLNSVLARLRQSGHIKDDLRFRIYAKLSGRATEVKVGEYLLKGSMRPLEFFSVLASGKSLQRQFTVPEGWNLFEIAKLFVEKGIVSDQESFMALVRRKELIQELLGHEASSLEGYLFPETYFYTKFDSAEKIVRMMVNRFNSIHQGLGPLPQNKNVSSRHQLVTLASVIEKETGAPEERPLIASVFHNRLKVGMKLQSDPTTIYGLWWETGTMPENLKRQDLQHPSPYNTYYIRGLPVGPIANPGREALVAAMNPSVSNFFFFVSRNDGTHVFTENLREHEAAVKKFQLDPKARAGRSWRDLQKRKAADNSGQPR